MTSHFEFENLVIRQRRYRSHINHPCAHICEMDMTWFDDPSMMMASEDEVQHMSVAKQVESQTPVQLDPDKITCEILKPIVPAACVACRTKHLKCDGMKPCSRCASHGVECSYIRSRRGYKGPRRMAKPSTGS